MIQANWKIWLGTAAIGLASFTATAKAEDSTTARLNDLENRMTELEVQKALQRFTFSGVMINRYEMFNTEYGDPGSKQKDDLHLPLTFLAINADVDVSKHVKVYTTLSMSKFWGDNWFNRNPPGSWQASEQGSYGISGATPQFDRAFMTYSFDFPLTLAVGRMPTNNGLPINQLDGLPREGTYPRMAFNGIFDGIAAVYDFSSLLPENNSLKARVFYTPWTFVNPSDRDRQLTDVPVNNPSGNPYKIDSSEPQWAFLADYSHKDLFGIMDQLTFEYMFYQYWNFYWDGFNGVNTGSNNPGNPIYDGRANTIYVGAENVAHVGLNASFSTLLYWSKEHASGNKTMSAAYLLNANEKLSQKYGTILGAEYIHTDYNYYLDEWTYLTLIPFYKIPSSHGFHFFLTQPVAGDHLTARIGVYNLVTGANPNAGEFSNSNSTSYYAQLRVDF